MKKTTLISVFEKKDITELADKLDELKDYILSNEESIEEQEILDESQTQNIDWEMTKIRHFKH